MAVFPTYDDGIIKESAIGGTRSPSEVIDGLTNTLFVAEKGIDLAFLGKFQKDDDAGFIDAMDHDILRYTSISPLRDTFTNARTTNTFGSSHTGTFGCLMGDGSVKSVNYSISIPAFQAMGSVAGGEINKE
jgi:hypothetical protein